MFIVIDKRYLKQYGTIRALRFKRTFEHLEQALQHITLQPNWYDLEVIYTEEAEVVKDLDKDF